MGPQTMFRAPFKSGSTSMVSFTNKIHGLGQIKLGHQKKPTNSSEAHGVYIIVRQPTSDSFARRRRLPGSPPILSCTYLQLCRRHRCEFVWIYVYFVVTGWIILVVVCQRGVRLLDLWVNADFSFTMAYLIVDLCIACCSWSKFLCFLNCLGDDQVWICKEFSCQNNFV